MKEYTWLERGNPPRPLTTTEREYLLGATLPRNPHDWNHHGDRRRVHRTSVVLRHPDIPDAALAQIISIAPILADLGICTQIAHHPAFGPIAASQLGYIWSYQPDLLFGSTKFAEMTRDVPLARCAVMLSLHWNFRTDIKSDGPSNKQQYAALIQRIAAHGNSAIDLAQRLCAEFTGPGDGALADNQHCLDAAAAVEAIIPAQLRIHPSAAAV